jgi:hypothetical protein
MYHAINSGFTNIINDTIIINKGGGSINPDVLITSAEYEMKVNGVITNIGIVDISDGNAETKVKSSIPLKTGDNVQFRYRSICSCCSNVQPTSGWTSWGGTTISLATSGQGLWDDIWKVIPNSWYLSGCSVLYGYYKITKDGKMYFRGIVETPIDYPTGVNVTDLDFLQVDTAIYNSLNTNTLSSTNKDNFALSIANLVTAQISGHANSVFNNLADKLAQEALTINIKNYFC